MDSPAVTIPILPSRDLGETSAFYSSLGFEERGRWPDQYLILVREPGIELHFWCHPQQNPSTNDVACYVRFDSADQAQRLHDEWAKANVQATGGRLIPPKETDYGLLEFALVDPSGSLLRLGGALRP